jgi:hypothetical protein
MIDMQDMERKTHLHVLRVTHDGGTMVGWVHTQNIRLTLSSL